MLGIKRSTVNQKQLSLISSDRLALHVINRGTNRQKKELYRFLTDIAVFQVSAADILVQSIMSMFKATAGLASSTTGPLQIDLAFYDHKVDKPGSMSVVLLQQSAFLHSYYSELLKTIVDFLPGHITASTLIYVAYLLERAFSTSYLSIPCAHCDGYVVLDIRCNTCCSIRNNMRELVLGLLHISMMLGNDYEMDEKDFAELASKLGFHCKQGYCSQLRHAIINRVDLTFSISIYEEFLYPKTIALHLCHSPFSTPCMTCGLLQRI